MASNKNKVVSDDMLNLLARLRNKVAIGFVGGSDLVKQQEQLGTADVDVKTLFDFCFAENGLTAYSMYMYILKEYISCADLVDCCDMCCCTALPGLSHIG